MFDKISYTWELMGASWGVLRQNRGLLIFPLFSGLSCLLVIASFAVPIFATDHWRVFEDEATQAEKLAAAAYGFAFYFANYFVITFFNVAIIACAVSAMAGGEPSVAGGFREAAKRIHLILGWSLLQATVGIILRAIEERSEFVGQIIAGLLGSAWSLMTFLVVPVLVVEEKGPVDAMKASAKLFKQTWGEQLVGNFSFGLIFFLLNLPVIVLLAVGMFLFSTGSTAVGAALFAVAVLVLIVLALVQSALQSIFQAAVYMHTQNVHTPAFPVRLLSGAVGDK